MIEFTKMQGLGNDYVYVDGSRFHVADPEALSRRISDRHFGVGGDGLILILPPEPGVEADVRMRMFNGDGGEAEMCGNGIRCVCKYAHDHGLCTKYPMRIQTGAGVLTLTYTLDAEGEVDRVTVDMGEPRLEPADLPLHLLDPEPGALVERPLVDLAPLDTASTAGLPPGLELKMTSVSMGNPHAVFYCPQVSAIPLEVVGPAIEHLPIFPRRVNVHFVQVHSPSEVTMVTWERGSGVTLACGTGAAAVCVAGVLSGRSERQIEAHLPGGDLLLRWDETNNHVYKTGPARGLSWNLARIMTAPSVRSPRRTRGLERPHHRGA